MLVDRAGAGASPARTNCPEAWEPWEAWVTCSVSGSAAHRPTLLGVLPASSSWYSDSLYESTVKLFFFFPLRVISTFLILHLISQWLDPGGITLAPPSKPPVPWGGLGCLRTTYCPHHSVALYWARSGHHC